MFNFIFKMEHWKFNKLFGVYVSTEGKVKDRYKRNIPIKINSNGYCSILTEAGFCSVHRLVLLTFKPIAQPEMYTVDHLDHNKRNNSLSNLEWITEEENQGRAKRDLIVFKKNGEIVFDNKVLFNPSEENIYRVNGVIMSENDLIDFIQYNSKATIFQIRGQLKKLDGKESTIFGLKICSIQKFIVNIDG